MATMYKCCEVDWINLGSCKRDELDQAKCYDLGQDDLSKVLLWFQAVSGHSDIICVLDLLTVISSDVVQTERCFTTLSSLVEIKCSSFTKQNHNKRWV